MMRRARAFLPLFACLSSLATAACGGESIPPAPGPAHQSPTATVAPSADPTATPTPATTPTATAFSTPAATPVSTPSLEPPPTVTPTPTPGPHGIEFMPIARGEPRPLPGDIALYYWVWACTGCDGGLVDLRRVVFDREAGAYREDRPLSYFDGVNASGGVYPVTGFAIAADGQSMAASVCSHGFCVLGMTHPSADAVQHVWLSRDAGRTWRHLGEVLPGTEIVEATEDDVLVLERNLWEDRESFDSLTEVEWEKMRARLSHLGLDEPEGWGFRLRWLGSGEAHTWLHVSEVSNWWFRYAAWVEGRPVWLPGWSHLSVPIFADVEPLPALDFGRLDWDWTDVRAGNVAAWTTEAQGDHLLAIAGTDGAVLDVYGAVEPLWGHFATDSVLVRPMPSPRYGRVEIRGAELVDLTTRTIAEVAGLSLPLGFDPETDGPQQEYYHFWTARTAPAPD